MKVREGFVSNSSSSSFILPVDSESKTITISISIDDLKDMSRDSYDETKVDSVITNLQELDAYIVYQFGDNFKEELEYEGYDEQYKSMVAMIESGKSIVIGRISYGNDFIVNLIEKIGGKVEN